MAGDVFGNGMLLSPHIKLIGAFNHLHIIVDPDPDPAKSLAERQRLYDLPRSSWGDYDAKLLSKGGAIFDRSAKTLKVSKEVQARFGLAAETVTPNALINALLKAEIDLLWFGGIGTYVKASTESQLDAGDRTNDAVRVSVPELRCKVIGEGAIWRSPSGPALSSRSRVGASTPTPSITRPGWIPRITRSTSRFCWVRWWRPAI